MKQHACCQRATGRRSPCRSLPVCIHCLAAKTEIATGQALQFFEVEPTQLALIPCHGVHRVAYPSPPTIWDMMNAALAGNHEAPARQRAPNAPALARTYPRMHTLQDCLLSMAAHTTVSEQLRSVLQAAHGPAGAGGGDTWLSQLLLRGLACSCEPAPALSPALDLHQGSSQREAGSRSCSAWQHGDSGNHTGTQECKVHE